MLEHNPTWDIIDSSKLKDFMRCRRKAMFNHIFGWKALNTSNHLIFGRAFHLPLEHFLLNGYNHETLLSGYQLMVEDYRKDLGAETDEMFEPKTLNNAFYVLAAYINEYKNELKNAEVLHTEVAGSVSISKDNKLYFRLDSLLRDKTTGKIFSLEHKTGSGLWNWADQWALSTQVGTYTHVMNCLYPSKDVGTVILNSCHFLRSKGAWKDLNEFGKTTKKLPWEFYRLNSPRTANQMNVWLSNVNYYYSEFMNEIDILMNDCRTTDTVLSAFPMNENSCISFGRVCEFQDFCTAWPNPLSKFHEEPPMGFKVDFWNPMEAEAKHVVSL
ncbi:MAG: hypothetical protein DRH37_01235 [Deltaproteobacteria bacterium]|nr:MAG: hypothetical protein DRH37_01235 [Deltaproteobacteria bacterium]